jgi:hypothetical protein
MCWQKVSMQREEQEKDGELTLKTPCNNMILLFTTQQDKQAENFQNTWTPDKWGAAALTKSGNRVK